MSDLEDIKLGWEKLPFFNKQEFEKGVNEANLITAIWNAQSNPGKVFIKGHRVHHGAGGGILAAMGLGSKSSRMLGIAYGLMEDDYSDVGEWFDFKKEGNPDLFFSME